MKSLVHSVTLRNPTSIKTVILPHVIFKMSLKMEALSNFCWKFLFPCSFCKYSNH